MPESQNTEWKERWLDEYLAQTPDLLGVVAHVKLQRYDNDQDLVEIVTPDDLSPAAFKRFRQLALCSGRLNEELLAEGACFKRDAELLLHPVPSRHFTSAFVKIGYFEHDALIRYHDLIAPTWPRLMVSESWRGIHS